MSESRRTGPGFPLVVPGPPRESGGLTDEVGQEPGVAVDLVEQNIAAELVRVRAPPEDHHGVP